MQSKFLCGLLGIFLISQAQAEEYKIIKDQSKVTFFANATPGFLKISGEKGHAEGILRYEDHKSSGEVNVFLNDFVTGIDLRDEHMKGKYLETAKYPQAKLKLIDQIIDPNNVGAQNFNGLLTLKNVEKPISGTITFARGDTKKTSADANFSILLKDFGIETPVYKLVKVAEKVDVNAALEFEIIRSAPPSTRK